MQTKKTDTGAAILLSLFIVSLSLFTYQVTLTRLYSAILSYHYVFLTTSFAVLGLGIGSVLAYKDKARLRAFTDAGQALPKMAAYMGKLSFILACSFITVFILIYIQPFVDYLIVYIILGIIPFVVSGYLYAMLFKAWPFLSGRLYFADLLGAGAGSVVIVILLNSLGMFRTVVLICLLPLIVTLLLPCESRKLKAKKYILLFFLVLSLFLPMQAVNFIEINFYALLNNTGKTFGDMKRSGLAPEIVFSRWDSFARTDLIKMGAISEVRILTIDGSANAPMYVWDGNIESLDALKVNTGFLPFSMGSNNKALIIGAGGGRGVLYALAGGSTDITAIEINPASIEAVRAFGDFNGFVFDRPEVKVDISDGRNFVRTTNKQFDLIFLSIVVTNTTQGAGFALSENYIHTVEAMEDYLGILSNNGKIAFVAHDQHSLARLTTTAMQALINKGVPLEETPNYLALFHQFVEVNEGTAMQMVAPVIIVKSEPFTETESRALEQEILNIGGIGVMPSYIPYVHEEGILRQVKDGQATFTQFIDSFDLRADPVTDNSPYFFNFDKGVPTVVLQILIFSLISTIALFAPFAGKKSRLKPFLYFGLLGMGFMMVQIPLIQKFILYLGHPTPAFSYTLAAMLVGCGIGGFLNGCKPFRKPVGILYLPPILAAVVIIVLLLSLNSIFQLTAGLAVTYKVIIAGLIAASTGFFMGMPFPRGLILLGENNKADIIPLMWGINGAMSVIGSVMSIILSMTFGFSSALMAGALIYLLIGLFKVIK